MKKERIISSYLFLPRSWKWSVLPSWWWKQSKLQPDFISWKMKVLRKRGTM